MSKVTSGIVLFSLLMALSLGVAFGSDVAAPGNVTENANNTNNTNLTNQTNDTNVTGPIIPAPVEAVPPK